jgi:hypothetical protein
MRPVLVRWVDSMLLDEGSWVDVGELLSIGKNDIEHTTIGFVLRDDDLGLVLASSLSPDEKRACGGLFIPREAIRSTTGVPTD